jgi:hypothetical protein
VIVPELKGIKTMLGKGFQIGSNRLRIEGWIEAVIDS